MASGPANISDANPVIIKEFVETFMVVYWKNIRYSIY